MGEKESLKTPRTTVKRLAERGHYERADVYALLDSGFVCHIGFCVDNQPFVIPTAYWRQEDYVYFHGSAASRMLKTLSGPIPLCLTATHIDGLVLARSGFHHSMNYRSVVVLGVATVVADPKEKAAAMRAFVDYVLPGRWSEIREPNDRELRATLVLKIPIQEASVKIRTGGPKDDAADLSRNVWAGVIPFHTQAGSPTPAVDLAAEINLPSYLQNYRIRG